MKISEDDTLTNKFKLNLWFLIAAVTIVPSLEAQQANYDESMVPEYKLPNPLTFESGQPVRTKEDWSTRRKEIRSLFEQHVYGVMPSKNARVKSRTVSKPLDLKNGIGSAVEIELDLFNDDFQTPARIVMFLPDSNKPVPVFVGYNFQGNHTVSSETGITLANVLDRKNNEMIRATDATRGSMSRRWDIENILNRGYGLVTLYYGDVDPDFDDGFKNGVHRLYPELQNRDDNWTSIGAWAWGLSRVADYLETNSRIRSDQLIVFGHSRLGKTSLWAGATDERFSIVISNNSGCGGAALARRRFGETVERINKVFPHWFCKQHKTYDNNEAALPVDQHMLIALMAPRPAYIASAAEDKWADPKGEFLSGLGAQPVYDLLGVEGGLPDLQPELDRKVGNHIGYHVRSGKHDVTAFDWKQYLDFADFHLKQDTSD